MPKTDDSKFNIPEGHDPAEFLNDADLAEYHRRRLEAAPADHPDRLELERLARTSRRAAAATAEANADLIADAAATAEATSAPKK